jgi:hypothetical protein
MADPFLGRQSVPDRVLHQGLNRQVGHLDRQHLGRDEQADLESLAEAGLLQDQVALDVAKFLLEGREVSAATQRVAREVGELEQQIDGPESGSVRTKDAIAASAL